MSDVFGLCNVALGSRRLAAGSHDIGDDLLGAFTVTRVIEDHRCAFDREATGNLCPNALRCTGYDGDARKKNLGIQSTNRAIKGGLRDAGRALV